MKDNEELANTIGDVPADDIRFHQENLRLVIETYFTHHPDRPDCDYDDDYNNLWVHEKTNTLLNRMAECVRKELK